jgi:large conductance mechanosensitive channel
MVNPERSNKLLFIKNLLMFKEFKDFAMKGNLIDIAVGLVMATAFGTIVAAFVDGMFMPLVGKIFQLGDMAKAEYVLSPEVLGADGKVATPKSAIQWGRFVTAVINFIIIAWVMFMIVKAANKMKEPPPAAPAGPTQEELLTQIRDLLKR